MSPDPQRKGLAHTMLAFQKKGLVGKSLVSCSKECKDELKEGIAAGSQGG